MESNIYIVYKDTIFIRKIKGGWELAETYHGDVDLSRSLPDKSYIKSLIKQYEQRYGKMRGKTDRIALLTWDKGATREAQPGWGPVAGNLQGQSFDEDDVQRILDVDDVQAIVFVDREGNVEYVEAKGS